jgi:hypothetical protein
MRCGGCNRKTSSPLCIWCRRRLEKKAPEFHFAINKAVRALFDAEEAAAYWLRENPRQKSTPTT